MGKRIQAHYGQPMDTEWAFENGTLFLLQARPITTLGDVELDESNSYDVGDVLQEVLVLVQVQLPVQLRSEERSCRERV